MTQKTRDRLCDLDEIHMKLHCSIEAVRQSWTAMTQGENEPCTVTSSRFDSTAFKKAMPELAERFTCSTTSRRFVVA